MASDVIEYSVVDNPAAERFEIFAGDELAGFTLYKRRRGLIAFVHTEVDPEFEGHGVASKLISTALDTARSEGLVVLPFCPFVRGYIEKHHEYLDLVPAEYREQFDLPADG
jgi:uncharacterized protein